MQRYRIFLKKSNEIAFSKSKLCQIYEEIFIFTRKKIYNYFRECFSFI